MKIFFAQWKRDMVSLRSLLWVWVICLGLVLLIDGGTQLAGFSHASAGEDSDFSRQIILVLSSVMLAILLVVIQALLLLLLVSGLVHADGLTDLDAFWRTRPIPRSILLGEKLAFVVFLTAGSLLTASVLHFGNQPLGSMLLHAVVFMAGLMAFAAVTANFFQIIVNLLGLALGAKILAAIILAVAHGALSSHGGELNLSDQGSFWISGFSLACFLGVIICQYLTSRTKLCRTLLFATFLITTLWQGR